MADLFGFELNGVDLREAKLCGTILNAAKLNGADLEEADLTDAQLGMADLRNANLAFSKLIRTDLHHVKLIGANLLRAEPWKANLYMPTCDDVASFLPYRDEVTDQYVMQSDAEREIAEKEINSVACLLETCRSLGETYGKGRGLMLLQRLSRRRNSEYLRPLHLQLTGVSFGGSLFSFWLPYCSVQRATKDRMKQMSCNIFGSINSDQATHSDVKELQKKSTFEQYYSKGNKPAVPAQGQSAAVAWRRTDRQRTSGRLRVGQERL